MSARKLAKATPRRKAGSKAPKKKRVIAFRLVVEAQVMLVRYTPDYSGSEYAQGHFEFRSPHRPARRIAISETGFRSHFAAMEIVKASGSPQEYAREYVLACLDVGRTKSSVSPNQLALF